MTTNDNETWNETWADYEVHAESTLDGALARAAEDNGNGPLHPALFLIDLAGRTIARAVVEQGVDPKDACDMATGRARNVMLKAVERWEATRPSLRVVK